MCQYCGNTGFCYLLFGVIVLKLPTWFRHWENIIKERLLSMKIEILGMGCAKCKQLMANAEKAVKEAGVQAEVVKVEDMNQIVGYGYNAPTCLDQS